MKQQALILLLILTIVFCCITNTSAKGKSTFAENDSSTTLCAEEDNINVCLSAKHLKTFQLVARHPVYDVGVDNCDEDRSGCASQTESEITLTAKSCQKLWDDTVNVIEVCEEPNWWRPYKASVRVNNVSASGHRLVLSKKIEGDASWPQFMVLYEDGYMRLKPHPPIGRSDVCFGSSVVVGPVAPNSRPFVDIQEIEVNPATLCLEIKYRDGGAAQACLSVDRVQAVANVRIGYSVSNCFAVFRSMWVQDGNSDVDHIQTNKGDLPILAEWDRLRGPSWLFHRVMQSKHNTSAPDILVKAVK